MGLHRKRTTKKVPTVQFPLLCSAAWPPVPRPCWCLYKQNWADPPLSAMCFLIHNLVLQTKKKKRESEYSPRSYLILWSADRYSVLSRITETPRQTQYQVSYNWPLVRGQETQAVGASALGVLWQQLLCLFWVLSDRIFSHSVLWAGRSKNGNEATRSSPDCEAWWMSLMNPG